MYAGIQKFADPGYLRRGAPTFIGTQLRAFAHGSPVGFLLNGAAAVPVATGVVVAVGEIAIGAGTLLGIAPLAFGYLGLTVNLVLFLTATWHVHPFFLGSDSIYAVAWFAYTIGFAEIRRQEARADRAVRPVRKSRPEPEVHFMDRRDVLRGLIVGVVSIFSAMLGVAVRAAPRTGAARRPGAVGDDTPSPAAMTPVAGATSTKAEAASGPVIARLSRVPVGGALTFRDPTSGDPSILLRPARNSVQAFSRVCTHAGCLVEYDSGSGTLVCPCHGAEFDPSNGAQPIAGPAFDPLPRVKVAIEHGEIVAG